MEVPIAEKVIRTIAVYAVIVVLFRLAGKRGLANLNTFDFVVIFLLSNVVQNAIIGQDNSLLGGIIGATTLVAVNAAVNRLLASSDKAAHLLEGGATTVIKDGDVLPGTLRRLALRSSELEHAVRLQDGDSIDDVALARLEPDGQLVVTLKAGAQNATQGDIDALQVRLARIEELLTTLARNPTSGA